jgi:hypothetical protein
MPEETRVATAPSTPSLATIGKNLLFQDNRCTADPMFCVQVRERIGPIMPEYGNGNVMYHNHDECETYYSDRPDPEEWERLRELDERGDLPSEITVGSYVERWFTVQVCFTEEGCKKHLDLNAHNYRKYHGVRVYVDSFHRNPEMLLIREFLLSGAGL